MERIRTKRTARRAQTTRLINEVSTVFSNETYDLKDLTLLHKRLSKSSEELKSLNREWEPFVADGDLEQEYESVMNYEDQADNALETLMYHIDRLKCRQTVEAAPATSQTGERRREETPTLGAKLPKLEMLKFDGRIGEWQSFWGMFINTVHENAQLRNIDKFQYLRSLLTGTAAKAIAGIQVSDSCYSDAVEILKGRFGDTRLIIQDHLAKLRTLQKVKSSSDRFALRNLFDTVQIHIRGLKALGVDAISYSAMLYEILLKVLPSDIVIEYYRRQSFGGSSTSATTSASGDLDGILEYLKVEVEIRERMDGSDRATKDSGRSSQPTALPYSVPSSTVLHNRTNPSPTDCFFCGSQTHKTEECDTERSLEEKKNKLAQDRRCYKCTIRAHQVRNCRRRISCDTCKGRHATTMCDPRRRSAHVFLGAANMADDVHRKQKVAAGFKRLKQFQQRSVKKTAKRKSSESISPPTVQEDRDAPEVCYLEQSSSMASPSKAQDTHPLTAHFCQNLSTLASENQPRNRVRSSTESLRKITLQLNGLMSDTNAAINGAIAALANSSSAPRNEALLRRNQERATSLESLQQDRDQLELQLQELRDKLTRQQREFEREQQEREDQSRREVGAVNDQLQVYTQTIGILVAEKTELQSALSQSQQAAKQKAVETEELQWRLKEARERNTDLERKLNSVSNQTQVQEKSSKEYLKKIDRLKTEQYKSRKSIEELKQELTELSDKLGKKVKDNAALQQELGEAKKELSLAQLYGKQLGGTQASDNMHNQLEELHQEKTDLEKKVNEFRDAMEQIAAEKQQMSSHYLSYVDRLSQQLEANKALVEKLSEEKALLEKKAAELLNRPLTFMHSEHDEPRILTPAHFLIGKRRTALPSSEDAEALQRRADELSKPWSYRQLLVAQFWKRWMADYLLASFGASREARGK